MTSAPAHSRFAFDTVFDDGGGMTTPARKPSFSAAEVDQARAEGIAEGERRMAATVEGQTAQALQVIAAALGQAFPALMKAAHEHREGSARLALAAAGKIADAALDRFPTAPVQAALDVLAREIEAAPRLMVSVAPETAEAVAKVLAQAQETSAFSGQISVRSDPALAPVAFAFDWGDGRAAFAPQEAAGRVAAALEAALAAEGLHAESLSAAEFPSSDGGA